MSDKNDKLDRDALHSYVFRHANTRGLATIRVDRLADELGIRADHMSRIFNEMVVAERLKKIRASNAGVTFRVTDPEEWTKEHRRSRRGKRRR